MRSSINLTGRPVTRESTPAMPIVLARKCLLPKLPPVYIGWKLSMWGGMRNIIDITQEAELSMLVLDQISIVPFAGS